MRELILVGAGGCMRELVWQIQELNRNGVEWKIKGYTDNLPPENGVDIVVGIEHIRYLGNDEILLAANQTKNVAICVGNPALRKKIATKLLQNPNLQFPNLILSNIAICQDLKLGKGCIISMDAKISTNVNLGDFVFVNMGSRICHDGRLDDYVTVSPDVSLAGNVYVGAETEIGIGAKVIQGIRIGENTVIGAGSVIIRNIDDHCMAAGVPGKKIKQL